MFDVGRRGELHGGRYLHHRRQSGRKRKLCCRHAGTADLHRWQGQPVRRDHVGDAQSQSGCWRLVHAGRHIDSGAPRCPEHRWREFSGLFDFRWPREFHWSGYLHDQRQSGRQCQLQCRLGPAVPYRWQGFSDPVLRVIGAGGCNARRRDLHAICHILRWSFRNAERRCGKLSGVFDVRRRCELHGNRHLHRRRQSGG